MRIVWTNMTQNELMMMITMMTIMINDDEMR
jgi:hypothetical protein